MNLRWVHAVLILLSAALAVLFGIWSLGQYWREHESVMLLTAVTAYQFQPERLMMYAGVGLAGTVAGLILWVLFRINRNELVSRVCRSTPGRFSLDSAFVQNVLWFVLPLVLVVGIQLAGRMRSVFEPVLGWLR